MRTAFVIAVASRLFVFIIAVASSLIFVVNPACAHGCGSPQIPFFNLFSRWDGEYYADISINGYSSMIAPKWEFFPLYPALMGIFGRLLAFASPLPLTLTVYVAGFAISNLAFLISIYLFYALSALVSGSVKTASESAILLAIYPAGVFLSAVYSESLFLLLIVASLLYWYNGKRVRSGVLGFLAALTRPVGVLLVIPYLYDTVTDSSNRKSFRSYISIAIIASAYLCFILYSQIITGMPFANFVAERLYWGVTLNPVDLVSLAQETILEYPYIIPYFFVGVGGLCASIVTARLRAEKIIGLFSVCLLASYLLTPIISFPRYSLTLLPMYWGLSKLSRSPWVRGLLYGVFLFLLAVGIGLFANWYSFY